jgi:hypothetical protein
MVKPSGKRTTFRLVYRSEPTAFWRERLERNARNAEAILATSAFLKECMAQKMTQTDKSVEEVCRDMQYAGPVVLEIGFYERWWTRAIAREMGGYVDVNTAKVKQGAGSPGNIVHEFAHTLGYRHKSNLESRSSSTVPYVIGYIVDRLSNR